MLACSKSYLYEVTGEATREDDAVKIPLTRRIARNGGHISRVRGITCLVFVPSRPLSLSQLLTGLLHRFFPGNCDESTVHLKRRAEDWPPTSVLNMHLNGVTVLST